MTKPGYELKKGETIFIPFPSGPDKTLTAAQQAQQAKTATAGDKAGAAKGKDDVDMRRREIRVGVMLPLHDINGDGRVNVTDITLLSKYISDSDPTGVRTENADINGDGRITVADVVELARMITNE